MNRVPLLPLLLLILSATTGLVDAVAILGLGKVFTANMTGNIVFLAFAAAGAPGFAPWPYVVALVSFMVGAALAGRGAKALDKGPLRRWLMMAALGESSALLAAAGLALLPSAPIMAIIALTALAMGIRNATVRALKVPDLTTTVLTLTLAGMAADSSLGGGANPHLPRRLAAVGSIFAGAWLGAWLVGRWGLALPIGLAAMVCLAATWAIAPCLEATAAERG